LLCWIDIATHKLTQAPNAAGEQRPPPKN
jgi:hypothetical protein